jgi:hypothetical protein
VNQSETWLQITENDHEENHVELSVLGRETRVGWWSETWVWEVRIDQNKSQN